MYTDDKISAQKRSDGAFGLGCVAMTERAAKRQKTSGDTHSAEDLGARKGSNKKRSPTPGECECDIERTLETKKEPGEKNVFIVLNGRAPRNLEARLVTMTESYQAKEANDIFNALLESPGFPVVCGFDCQADVERLALTHRCLQTCSVKHGELSWTILYDERAWDITSMLQVMDIIPRSHSCVERKCAHCVMQKRNSDAGQFAVNVILLKVHRGKAQCMEWFVNQEIRRLISEFIEGALTDKMPTLIVGDLGMGANYLLGQQAGRKESSLIYNLPRDAQIAVSTMIPGWKQQVRDMMQSSDIMIFEYVQDTSDATQVAGEMHEQDNEQEIVLISRAQKMLEMLEGDDGSNDLVCMNALWHPIQTVSAADLSGERTMRPRNMKKALKSFSKALEMLAHARKQGLREVRGLTGDMLEEYKGTLSQPEFVAALEYLKKEFHLYFMENQDLKDWYTWLRDSPKELNRKQKDWTRKHFRTAFRTWATKLVGEYRFFLVVLQHGLFEPSQRAQFVRALLTVKQEHEDAGGDAHRAGETRTRDEELKLRRAALQARLKWRKANKLYQWVQENRMRFEFLKTKDKDLVLRLDSGQLKTERQIADKAYGHGRDVEILSVREAAILEAWSSDLRKYHERE